MQIQLQECLQKFFSADYLCISQTLVSGGDTHQSYVVHLSSVDGIPKKVFAKVNQGAAIKVLESEFRSLQLVNKLYFGVYPKPLFFEKIDRLGVLIMEFYEIAALDNINSRAAGNILAQQHKVTREQFGWEDDNFIGLTEQKNQWNDSWVDFFREQRLITMLALATEKGLNYASEQKVKLVIDRLDDLLDHHVVPSLVHGDLWSGNLGMDRQVNRPILFDPAPYFGDREVDLAMTELFGKQSMEFYQAYQDVLPVETGYENRKHIYNLYHALNHVVLFGSSYQGLVDSCLQAIEI